MRNRYLAGKHPVNLIPNRRVEHRSLEKSFPGVSGGLFRPEAYPYVCSARPRPSNRTRRLQRTFRATGDLVPGSAMTRV